MVVDVLLNILICCSKKLKFVESLEMAEEKIEEMAEAVEKVGEDVEKVAEEIEEKLPDGGKLKSAVTLVENVAKETVNDADKLEELIDKVRHENTHDIYEVFFCIYLYILWM